MESGALEPWTSPLRRRRERVQKKKVRLGRVRTGAHIVDQKTHDHSFPNEALISQLESGALDRSATSPRYHLELQTEEHRVCAAEVNSRFMNHDSTPACVKLV